MTSIVSGGFNKDVWHSPQAFNTGGLQQAAASDPVGGGFQRINPGLLGGLFGPGGGGPPGRQFTPGPMASVPYMPTAQVGPQNIGLRPPPAAPAPAQPAPSGQNPYNPFRPGGGFQMGPSGPAPMAQPGGMSGMPWQMGGKPAVSQATPGGFDLSSLLNRWKGAAGGSLGQPGNQTQGMPAAPPQTAQPFNGGMMNLGMGMLNGASQGQSLGQMSPQIMQQIMGQNQPSRSSAVEYGTYR